VQLSAWRFLQAVSDAEEAEAIACKEGLQLVATWCMQNAVLETDCSTIATMLAGKNGERAHSSLSSMRPLQPEIGCRSGRLSTREGRVIR
jgi:hypothetical protein